MLFAFVSCVGRRTLRGAPHPPTAVAWIKKAEILRSIAPRGEISILRDDKIMRASMRDVGD
jgi:hypothetical protein